jgi:cytochrome c biogenesis protein CcmG/thiol:disulfide interchange protein DsbE
MSLEEGGPMWNSCNASRWFVHAYVVVVLLSFGSLAPAQTNHETKEGDRAPYFSIQADSGKHIAPTAFGGKLLVVNFWETACAPCVQELPSLTSFARKFKSLGVVVVAISGDEDAEKYRRFLTGHHVGLNTYRDSSRKIGESFGTYVFPETYVIQDGVVVRKVVGAIDWTGDETGSFVRGRLARR